MRARPVLLPAVVLAVLLAAGCDASSSGSRPPSAAASTSGGSTASTSASASPSPSGFATTCDDALPLDAVSTAAGQPIVGTTSFVVGEADASIGRIGYLNCRYGLPDTATATPAATPAAATPAATPAAAVPAVEIGVSLYDTAAYATARVAGTVSDYRSTGATPAAVTVGDASGTLLTTSGQPRTLVVASGTRTVAVSMTDAVFTGDDQIAAVAALALDKAR